MVLHFDPPTWPSSQANYCDRKGAEELKGKIELYWALRGKPVQVWIEPRGYETALRGAHYVVRSNLVSGLPSPQQIERAA